MRTAVQLRLRSGDRDDARAEVLGGAPCSVTEGKLGPVALFESGEVVAYLVHRRRKARVFVFRTLDVDDRLAATVPGVSPRVRLLLEVRTPGRIQLARSLFTYLARTGHDPSGLPDGFYVRVGTVLNGRLPAHKILLPLLALHSSTQEERASLRTGAISRSAEGANQAAPSDVLQGLDADLAEPTRSEP